MAVLLSPFVYWAQSKKNLFIKIDLKDVKGPTIKLEKKTLEFESRGVGAQGPQNYGFSLAFYSEINTEESSCKMQDGKIRLTIAKVKKCWWPRLTTKLQKPTWLKKDLDYGKLGDDLINYDGKVQDISNRLQKEKFGYTRENLKQIYLITYNLMMFVGFAYVLSVLFVRYLQDGSDCFTGIYKELGTVIKYLHVLQLSEIALVTTASGYTSEGLTIFLVHILGQLLTMVCLIDDQPKIQTQPIIFCLYLIWSSWDIIRYPYNITQICEFEIYPITWLRHTIWIFSIPLGMLAEVITIHKSIPHLEDIDEITYSLHNVFHFFSPPSTFLQIFLSFICITVGCMSMSHMYKARIKKVGLVQLQNN